jgi:hypothetical protein
VPGSKGKAPWPGALHLVAWTLGLLALGSAFAPLSPRFLRVMHWTLTLFSILEAGIAVGQGRRWAFFLYAAIAVVMNPLRPFVFALRTWRLLHAAAGLWLTADHLGRA